MYSLTCQNFCWHFVQGGRGVFSIVQLQLHFQKLSFKWSQFLDSFHFFLKKSVLWQITRAVFWPAQFTIHDHFFWRQFSKSCSYHFASWRVILWLPYQFSALFSTSSGFFSIALKYNEPYIRYYKLCSALQSKLSQLPVSQQARALENAPLSSPQWDTYFTSVTLRVGGSSESRQTGGCRFQSCRQDSTVCSGRKEISKVPSVTVEECFSSFLLPPLPSQTLRTRPYLETWSL